jgi:hypothetical protein
MAKEHYYCVDDIQRIHKIVVDPIGDTKLNIIVSGELKGKIISKDFLYLEEEQAHEEVSDRHTRLHKAFKNFDLITCLSINKEPSRKMEGYSRAELDKLAHEDKTNYKGWIKNLERSYEEINNEKPDLEKLSRTLKNANLVKKALENPLAIDFIEIMAKEAQLNKTRQKESKVSHHSHGNPEL